MKWYQGGVLAAAALGLVACADSATAPGANVSPVSGPNYNTGVSGAVFTSTNPAVDDPNTALTSNHDLCANAKDSNGPAIDCNIYLSKSFVWLTGGPGPSNLENGTYMFAVLVPGGQGGNDAPNDGTINDLSDLNPTSNTGAGDAWTNRVFTVTDGVIGYAGTHNFVGGMIRLMPYDNTTNPGGEYVMAVCNLADRDLDAENPPGVDPSDCKYDNFKVKNGTDNPCIIPSACQGTLTINKFYDANGDGIEQNTEVRIRWGMTLDGNSIFTPYSALADFGNHVVVEGVPSTGTWFISHKDVDGGTNGIATPIALSTATAADKTVNADVSVGQTTTVLYGNYCTVRPGGLTLGFWSNKNGQAIFGTAASFLDATAPLLIANGQSDLQVLTALNLRNANGTPFDPANYAAYRTWLLNATATNMAYMLSAQLSATVLDLRHAITHGNAVVDVINGVNMTVYDEVVYANTLLGANGNTVAASADRTEQERVKNILDKINNNGGLGDFIQPSQDLCPTPFPAN
jgi:hypothetical protein